MEYSLVNHLDADTCLTKSAWKCVKNIGNDNGLEETIQLIYMENFLMTMNLKDVLTLNKTSNFRHYCLVNTYHAKR